MIGIVRGADGKPTGGLHRTFLAYDGNGKADMEAPRKMLGPVQNGAVRLAPVGDDGVLGVAEGIETAIANGWFENAMNYIGQHQSTS
jgi:hypothetical protein